MLCYVYYFGEINIEEEGFFGVRNLNAILLIRIGVVVINVDVVNSFCYSFHF